MIITITTMEKINSKIITEKINVNKNNLPNEMELKLIEQAIKYYQFSWDYGISYYKWMNANDYNKIKPETITNYVIYQFDNVQNFKDSRIYYDPNGPENQFSYNKLMQTSYYIGFLMGYRETNDKINILDDDNINKINTFLKEKCETIIEILKNLNNLKGWCKVRAHIPLRKYNDILELINGTIETGHENTPYHTTLLTHHRSILLLHFTAAQRSMQQQFDEYNTEIVKESHKNIECDNATQEAQEKLIKMNIIDDTRK